MMSPLAETVAVLARSTEVALALKATIALLIGLAVVRASRGARASRRHLVLACTFGGLMALPLVAMLAPVVPIELPIERVADVVVPEGAAFRGAAVSESGPVSSGPAATTSGATRSLARMLPAVMRTAWVAGALFVLGSLLTALWRLARIRRDGVPWLEVRTLVDDLANDAGVRRPLHVLLHEEVVAPLTCGMRHPAIALPSDARQWSEADVRRALVHELEHVRRGDWAVQLLAQIACAVYWFHPLAWRALRGLRLEAERACDDAVIRGAGREDYAEQLVSLAQRIKGRPELPAPAMASRSDLSVRVMALLDANQRRGRAGALATAAVISAAALFVLTMAPVRQVDAAARVTGVDRAAHPNDRPGPLDEPLYEASERGDIATMKALLAAGANVNAVLEGDGSPLIGAAREGRLAAVQLLLDGGADVDLGVRGDGNPLIMAAREGHAAVVELLLSRGARIDEIVPEDENALIQASGHGRLVVVKLLVARGADLNARAWSESSGRRDEGEWRTPLSEATKGGHAEVVAFLRSAGAQQ